MKNAAMKGTSGNWVDFLLILPAMLLCGLKFVAVPGLACILVLPFFQGQLELVWQAFLSLAFTAWVGGTFWGLWTVRKGAGDQF